jgi:hypothetical protein
MFSTTTKAKDTILEGELTQVETTPFRGCSAVLVGGSAPAFKYGPLGGKKKAMEVIDIASVASVAGEENEFAIVTIHGSRTVFAAGSQRESQRWADELTALVAKHGGGGAKRGSGAGPPALQGLARRQSRRLERRSSAEPYAPPRRGSSTGLTPRMASLGGGPSDPGWDEGSAPKPPKAAFPPPPKDRRGSGVARAAAARKADDHASNATSSAFPNPPTGRAAGGASLRQRPK